MAINFPTYEEIINRTRADIAQLIPELDPTIFSSFIRGITDSQSGRAFDIVLLQQQLLKQLFPQTADGDFLENRWAAYEGITRNQATPSTGFATVTGVVDPSSGTPGTIIPAGTLFNHASGSSYAMTIDATITSINQSISSLTRSGQTVTATTASDHNLASNIEIEISGANETEYNGIQTITVTGSDTFTYVISGTPATPATGTLELDYGGASIALESVDQGTDQNADAGAKLTVVSPLTGLDPNAYVQFAGLTGGTDIETDAALLVRVLQSRANPVANFNVAAIEKACLSVSGVTRVKVKRVTPEVGDVTVLFVRDNDGNGDSIIPDAGEVATVKNVLLDIAPVNTPDTSVIVTAPTPIRTDYTFTSLTPDTPTMRTAIAANLEAFYRDSVDFEVDITEDKYRSAIIDTIDPETGDELTAFALSAPSGDITVLTDAIGTLGDIILP